MSATRFNWSGKGFASAPEFRVAPPGGVFVYRCFDLTHSADQEWGTGYFSIEKPQSVVDAELRLNIVEEWGNLVRFVSTFRLRAGYHYWAGLIAHGDGDLRRPATQVYIEGPLRVKLEVIRSREVLKHDAFVVANRVGQRRNS